MRVASKFYVDSAASHVGGDGHRGALARLRNYLSLLLVVLCVQYRMLYSCLPKMHGQKLVFLNGNSTDQNRLAFRVQFFDLLGNRMELAFFGLKDEIVMVFTDHGLIGRNHDHVQPVHFYKLFRGSRRGSSHAGQLLVVTKKVLEGNGARGEGFLFYFYRFCGLNSPVY